VTDHLITRPARIINCPRCGALALTAVTGGLTTVTSIEPLSIDQEIAALLTGRTTFDMQIRGTHIYLEWRDVTRIQAGREYPVVAIHQCTPAYQLVPLPVPAGEEVPDDPPF
jgi:hypothetical protein